MKSRIRYDAAFFYTSIYIAAELNDTGKDKRPYSYINHEPFVCGEYAYFQISSP